MNTTTIMFRSAAVVSRSSSVVLLRRNETARGACAAAGWVHNFNFSDSNNIYFYCCRRVLSSTKTSPPSPASSSSTTKSPAVATTPAPVAAAKPAAAASTSPPSPPPAKAADQFDESALSPVAQRMKRMSRTDPHMIWGNPDAPLAPPPILPKNVKEIAALDPDQHHQYRADGQRRTVVIRQEGSSVKQSPLHGDDAWRIHFQDDGATSEVWTNSLMGWASDADPYQSIAALLFPTAADAVYFCQKKNWQYIVKKPILRYMRNDNAQYQDNFLPQALAAQVSREKTSCDYWHRTASMTSHYARPLKYHGDGTVKQHGPNADAPIAPHVPGMYKLR